MAKFQELRPFSTTLSSVGFSLLGIRALGLLQIRNPSPRHLARLRQQSACPLPSLSLPWHSVVAQRGFRVWDVL